jgi:SAM-dependent methyltransferase
MTPSPPHPLFPRQSPEEDSRHAFHMDLKALVVEDLKPRIAARYASLLAPAFVAAQGREPATAAEAGAVVAPDPAYRWYSALARAQHELYVDSTAECVERQADVLAEACRDLRDGGGTGSLQLDPALVPPPYQSEVDIHCVPGGYCLELGPDDVRAAARYELGISLYTLGRHGAMNDSKGQTGVAFLRGRFPRLAPRRILELGCTCGNSTLPYVDAWPQAEVHAIDLSAPALRYAHARARALGRAVHFRQASAEASGYEPGSFDLVVSHILLHEVSAAALRSIFAECHRLLRDGGVMLHVEVPVSNAVLSPFERFMADWETDNNNEPFWRALHETDLRAVAASVGFAPDQVFDTGLEGGARAFINDRPWWLFGAMRGPGAAP